MITVTPATNTKYQVDSFTDADGYFNQRMVALVYGQTVCIIRTNFDDRSITVFVGEMAGGIMPLCDVNSFIQKWIGRILQ